MDQKTLFDFSVCTAEENLPVRTTSSYTEPGEQRASVKSVLCH